MVDQPAKANRARLRDLIASGRTIIAPGASDALSAKLIQSHGFECVYIGSYATAASRLGLPDTGLLSLEVLVVQAKTIADAVRVPVIADAESGFDDPAQTARAFEDAGVAAIHIEDHTGAGKHTDLPQRLRPMKEVAERIRAAVKARRDRDFMIVARSDAWWVHKDLDDCIARLSAYADAGADMIFPTAVNAEQLAQVKRRIARPAMIIDIPGRRLDEHSGAAIVLFYGFSVLVQFEALDRALARFKSSGEIPNAASALEDFLGRN